MSPKLGKFAGVIFSAVLLLSWFPHESKSANANQIKFFNLYNDYFQKMGAGHSLVMTEELNQAATNHAHYMELNRVFSHTEEAGKPGFTGVTFRDRADYAGATDITGGGENITGGFSNPEDAFYSWMWSLPHRANMMTNCNKYIGFFNNISSYSTSVLNNFCPQYYSQEKVLMKYPYSGQTGVPVARGANGYVTSVVFGYNAILQSNSFKDSQGADVPLLTNSECLAPWTFCPVSPLKYNETYTVNVKGQWEYAENFDISWSFTTEAKDFSLGVNSNTIAVNAGEKATYGVTVSPVNNPTYPVSLSVTGLPTGATASFSQNNLVPSFSSNLYVQTASNSPPGTYPLTLKGVGGGMTHTKTINLIIKEKPILSAAASPATITYLSPSTLKGELKDNDGTMLLGKRINIQSLGLDRRWHALTSVTTGTDGKWSYVVKPSRNVSYRATYSGNSNYSSVISPAVNIKVKPKVGISARYYRIRRNRSDLIKFSVSPRHRNGRVGIQIKHGSSWRTAKWVRLSSYSYGKWYFKTSHTGVYYIRVVFLADSDHARSYSKEIRIRVVR